MPIVSTIGNSKFNDLFVDSSDVEPLHARIVHRPDGSYMIQDQGTTAGTWVDGQRITRYKLDEAVGVSIRIGSQALSWPVDFRSDEAVTPAQNTQSIAIVPPERSTHLAGTGKTILEVRDLEVWFPAPDAKKPALIDASLELKAGTITAILGPSGIGKSTLMRAILGEIPITRGHISTDGNSGQFNPELISFVPQKTHLLPEFDVLPTVEMAAYARDSHINSREAVEKLLADLDLTRQADRPVSKLSGGQERRVSIALELVSSPQLLMLDEPSSGLDEGMDRRLLELLRNIAYRSENMPAVLVVTHSTSHLAYVDQIVMIGTSNGEGTPATVRWKGTYDEVQGAFGYSQYADIMEDLRTGSAEKFSTEKDWVEHSGHTQEFVTIDPIRSFFANARRDWGGGPREVAKSLGGAALAGFLIVWLLSRAYKSGLSGSQDDPNQQFLFFSSMTVLFLAFWGTQLPVMRIVKNWEVIRREQRWGISARMHVVSQIVRQLPVILFAVLAAAATIMWLTPQPSVETPWMSHWWTLVFGLGLSTLASYSLGVLIGCMNESSETALKIVVVVVAAMIFLAGVIFYLPEIALLDFVSRAFPTRWGVAYLASSFDASYVMIQAPESRGLDPLFTLGKWGILKPVVAMVAITIVSLLLSMWAVPRSLRQKYTKPKKDQIQDVVRAGMARLQTNRQGE